MSSIGRISGGTASLDFTVDLNTASLSSIVAQEQKISDLQEEIYGIENEIKNDVIGDMGKVETIDEETGETTTTKTSVRENLETLYEIITGVTAVTEPELAVPLIGLKELYDEANHLYEQGHSVYDAINTMKNLLGHPHSENEVQDTDEYGNLKWYDPETQTLPIYKTIQPTALHARAYNLEQLLKIINTVEEASTLFELVNAVPKEYNYKDHLCINNDNEDGEIRFITKDAYKFNDHNYNWNGYNYFDPVELFVGSDNYFYKDPRRPNPDDPDGAQISNRLNYNVKIAKDGRLYFWHNEYILTLPQWTAIVGGGSGWYELDTAFNSVAFNVFLNQIQIAYLSTKITSKAVSEGAVAAAQGATTTVKEALLLFLDQFRQAALISIVVVSGLVAGQLLIDNAEVKQLQDSILDLDKDLNSLLLEIEKIDKEIQNIDDAKARDPDNKPFDNASLSKTDLEELKTKYLETIDAIKEERLRQQKILLKRIGFIHVDYLEDSRFNLDEVEDANGTFQNYKLVSNDLNHLVDNVGVKATDGTSTLLFKEVEDIIAEIGVDNQDMTSTGFYRKFWELFNLIGNKTLTTPPKDATGILGQIEEIQNILGITEDTETGETTLISRIETNENNISTIQGNITTINNNISGIETELGTSPQDGISINTKIADLQTYTGITNPLPTKSLKEEIDSIRTITGYDDSSLLYLLLPPNPDGTIPSIQENTINNDSLIHLGYKGTALKENFSDYFILYVMPHYSITTDITIANYYLVRDLVSNKDPSSSGLQIENATDEYVSALRGWIQYDDIILSNNWYFSIYIKNIQSYNSFLYKYNNIEVLINQNQIVVNYQKLATVEYHYLDSQFSNGLQQDNITFFSRDCVRFTNTNPTYQFHQLIFLANDPDRTLENYKSIFNNDINNQNGFEMYPFKGSAGDYFVYHTGARFPDFQNWIFNISRNWTAGSGFQGAIEVFIRIYIYATNTAPGSYLNFQQIYASNPINLGQQQMTSINNITLQYGQPSGYNWWYVSYEYTNSSGNIINDYDNKTLMFGKIKHHLVNYGQEITTFDTSINHNITFGNDFKHLVFNDRVANENKIVYYADGVQKGTIDIPSDRVLINNNKFLLGDRDIIYRSFGIGNGNGILTTQTVNEISQLSKTNYRVRIPELSVMDEVYITETLILENDIQFRNKVDGSTFNYYTETNGNRRRQAIQENGVTVDTFTYTDELIFRTPPTQNQFLFYNSTTGLFEGINTTDFYTKADIDTFNFRDYNQLVNKPDLSVYALSSELFDKDYNQLINKPDLSVYALSSELFDKDYNQLINKPDLSVYALSSELFDKDYNQLINKPDLSVYLTSIPAEYITETELDNRNYITSSSIPDNIVDTIELDSRNYISYDSFAKNQAEEIDPGIVKYNNITERFYTVDKIQKEDVDGLIDTIQNIPNVYTIAETFPVLNHLILDEYFEVSPVEYLELYVKYNDIIYTLPPHLYIEYTYLGTTYSKSTYDTTAINIHKHDIIRFVREQISSDNEPLNTHQYYFKNESGNIMTNDGGVEKKYIDTTMNWVQDTEYPLNYQIQLYRSNRDETNTNEILLATFKIIEQSYNKQFKPEVLPKTIQDITKINNDLQIDYTDATNTTINILDNSLVKNIEINGGFLNYTQLDDTVVNRTLPFIENDVDSLLTFFDGTTFTRNGANKIDLLEIDTFNENIIINGSASYGSGSIQLNCENNTHNVKIIAPAHSTFTGGNYSLTLPVDLGITGQVLSITPNSLTRDGRLFWRDRINIFDFNESQFETVSGKISIIPSVLGSGGGGGVSISDFNPAQFETNQAGEISIIDSVLGSGGGDVVVDYDDINVPYESTQTTTTETGDVIPEVYLTQRLYPSTYARQNYFQKIDGASPDEYIVANSPYGDGTYTIKYSPPYGVEYALHNLFYRPNAYPEPSGGSQDATWENNKFTNGVFNGTDSLGGVVGCWVSIQMPDKILLSKYILVSIYYADHPGVSGLQPEYRCRMPHEYVILGCNDGDGNWETIYEENNSITDNTWFNNTFKNTDDSYLKNLTSSDRLTGDKLFNTFALVVKKIGNWSASNNSVCAMAEWELYGNEIIEPQPIYENVSRFPQTYATSSALYNSDKLLAQWTDGSYTVRAKASEALNGTTPLWRIFNNVVVSYLDTWHTTQTYAPNTTGNYLSTGTTTFKGVKGTYIVIDLGRPIYAFNLNIAPRDNSDYPNINFTENAPGLFKVYASNDPNAYNDNNHSSWTLILDQTTKKTYTNQTFTTFDLDYTNQYQYFSIVTTHIVGSTITNYGYLLIGELYFNGAESLNPDYKTLTFTYQEPTPYIQMAETLTSVGGWYHIKHLKSAAINWYPDNNTEGRTFYEVSENVFDEFGSFTKPFPDEFDEILFTRSDGSGNVDRYVWCVKARIDSVLAATNWVGNLQSIKTNNGTSALFRGFGLYPSYVNRAPIITSRNDSVNEQDNVVYVEHYITSSTNEGVWQPKTVGKQYDVFARKSGTLSQTSYTLTFDNPTECDILIVGGGGSGGGSLGGGGGGGGVLFATFDSTNPLSAGTYNIKVGKGGDRVQSDSAINSGLGARLGITGTETEFEGTIVYGGGGGGDYQYHAGLSGGSGGGGGFQTANGGTKTLPTYGSFIVTDNSTYYGNDGESVSNAVKSGNGGSANCTNDISGTNYTYSRGGTGRTNGDDNSITNDDGVNYGDGGGGGGWTSDKFSGKGADGIVIIRYKTTYSQTITIGANIKPKGIMTHTDAGWQLIDMTDFSIIQALVSEITLLKQRLNALEATPTPTNTIVWSYRYFDTTTDITINNGTIIELDNTRVKHKVSIKITYISDFVDTKTYLATLEISGTQYGGIDILSVPTIINEVNESDLPTGAPVNYVYQVVEDSIVIGSKTIELYRPPGDVALKLTYRITTSSSNQIFTSDSDPFVSIPTGTWYELFIDDVNLYIVGVDEYDIYVDIEEADGSTSGDILWEQSITSFPVAQSLLSGVWSNDRKYRIKIRPDGAQSYITPLLTATIYGSNTFSGGVGGGGN